MEYHHVHEGYEIWMEKFPRKPWYIQVRHPDGGYVYDGWWRDSEDAAHHEAMEEALKGSLLPPLTTNSENHEVMKS